MILLEAGWRELFVLSAAQYMLPLEIGPLLVSAGLMKPEHLASGSDSSLSSPAGSSSSPDKLVTLMTEIRCFQEIITKLKDMRVDPTEYNCLKAIVLFKTGKQWPCPLICLN